MKNVNSRNESEWNFRIRDSSTHVHIFFILIEFGSNLFSPYLPWVEDTQVYFFNPEWWEQVELQFTVVYVSQT